MSFSWSITLWDTDVTPIDHQVEAPQKFGWQYKNSPRLNSLLQSFLIEIDLLEDVCRAMVSQRWPHTAEGVNLDNIGKIIVYDRPDGMTDDEYRIFCLCKIYANQCDGKPEDLIKILTLARLGISFEIVRLREIYPAEITVEVSDCDYPSTVFTVLQYGQPGGVLMDFIYNQVSILLGFVLHDSLSTVGSLQKTGFSWSGDPTLGGKIAGVFRS